jgi:hypothetical protein
VYTQAHKAFFDLRRRTTSYAEDFVAHFNGILNRIAIFGIEGSDNFIVDEVDFTVGENAVDIKDEGADVIESLFVAKHF